MGGTTFRLNLNLKKLSMISIATTLWDSQEIKNRIKNNFSGVDSVHPDENWCEISKLVVEYASSLNLPPSLLFLLKKTIVFIGQRIYEWNFYVTYTLGLDLISTQKIYFSFGVIDEIKIFDLYWRDLMAPEGFVYESDYFKHSPLFTLACMYGCEGFVKERKNEMLNELSQFYPKIKAGDEIYNIMSVSICMTKRNKIPDNVPPPQEMFEMCLDAGFSKAARFYWEKLNEIEKVSNLTNLAKECCRKFGNESYLSEKDCENLLFLINEMGEEERHLFFTDYADEIIILFLPVWPYRELILDLLKYDWNIESSRLLKMVDFLISFSDCSNPLAFSQELVFQIMQKTWEIIPVDEKILFFTRKLLSISDLFSSLNPKISTSITEIDGKKMDYLIKEGFLELIRMGKFDFLKTIIETVFDFIPESKEFLKENFSNHNFVRDVIEYDGSVGLIDQFLDWSADSEAERAMLKNKINTFSICRSLTEPPCESFNFKLAGEFLKWRLETEAEVKRFKEEMKSYNFLILPYWRYVRIKSGDLGWLSPGDSLAMRPDEDPYDNADGLTFLKFEDATELNWGVVLGIKSFCQDVDYDFLGPGCCHASISDVHYVGTGVGDFIVYTVREFWCNRPDTYFLLNEIVYLSNAFIEFYYETDEEVLKFKQTKLLDLVTENRKDFVFQALAGRSLIPDDFLDEFCEFCMIPSEEIEEIKIQERKDIEEFLDTNLIDQHSFDFVDIHLHFLYGEVKKTEVAKKYLNSSNKAALLIVSFIKKHGGVSPFGIYDYRNMFIWLNMVDDMEKLKNDVLALNENTPEWFPALLDRAANLDFNTFWWC